MENLKEKIKQIEAKITQLESELIKDKVTGNYITNCVFDYGDGRNTINIQTTNEDELASICGFLLMQEEFSEKVSEFLSIPVSKKYKNYPITDWKRDILLRMGKIKYQKKSGILHELKNKVKQFYSEDLKREIGLNSILNELNEKF